MHAVLALCDGCNPCLALWALQCYVGLTLTLLEACRPLSWRLLVVAVLVATVAQSICTCGYHLAFNLRGHDGSASFDTIWCIPTLAVRVSLCSKHAALPTSRYAVDSRSEIHCHPGHCLLSLIVSQPGRKACGRLKKRIQMRVMGYRVTLLELQHQTRGLCSGNRCL